MKKSWTGKKEQTNPVLKEAHKERVTRKAMLFEQQQKDWKEQVKDYDNQQV